MFTTNKQRLISKFIQTEIIKPRTGSSCHSPINMFQLTTWTHKLLQNEGVEDYESPFKFYRYKFLFKTLNYETAVLLIDIFLESLGINYLRLTQENLNSRLGTILVNYTFSGPTLKQPMLLLMHPETWEELSKEQVFLRHKYLSMVEYSNLTYSGIKVLRSSDIELNEFIII